MTIFIEASGLGLDYPLYSVNAQTLSNTLLTAAVGGLLMKSRQNVVIRALSNVNLNLVQGDRLALVGHNGSGKTSLLKVLAGVYSPSAGTLKVGGRITSMISSSVGLDAEATGLRNIYTLLRMQGLEKKEIAARTPEIVEFSELGAFIHMPFKTYSAGMMARLTFAIGTELEADILLMDEWLSAGDAKFRDKASRRIESFVDAAKLLILGTHDFELVTRNCNKVLILASGRPVFFGSTEDWLAMGAFNSEAPDINANYHA